MSSNDTISLELIPEEIRENRSEFSVVSKENIATDPQAEIRQAVKRYLALRNNPSGAREALLETVEETLLRYLMDSGQYSQRELADLLGMSRVTLRKKLDHYKIH
jgi:DNA-binding protein Fis